MRAYLRAVLSIAILACQGSAWADVPGCTASLAKSAETDVMKVVDWSGLHTAFRRYKACDDGAIGEGFSDRVTVLLSGNWQSLPQLGQLITRDREFEAFVIRHVDETADPGNLQRIAANARRGCPGLEVPTCGKLREQAEAALKVLRAPQAPRR